LSFLILVNLALAILLTLTDRSLAVHAWGAGLIGTGGPAIASVWCLRSLWKQRANGGFLRWSGMLLTMGVVAFSLGQSLYYYNELVRQVSPFPSWADASFCAAYPALIGGLLVLHKSPTTGAHRGRVLADALMSITGIGTLCWFYLIGPIARNGGPSLLTQVLAIAYPAFDLAVVFCLLSLVGSATVHGKTTWPLSIGLLVIIGGDTAFAFLNLHEIWVSGTLLEVCWPLGYMLLGLGVSNLIAVGRPGTIAPSVPSPTMSVWRSVLPYGLIPMFAAMMVHAALSDGDQLTKRGVYVGALALVAMVILRQVLAIRENGRLNATLRESEERYRMVSRATNDAIWNWDPATGRIERNESMLITFGHDPDLVRPTSEWWAEHVHPEDRAWVSASLNTAVVGATKSWTATYRFRRGDGTYVEVMDRAFINRDHNGKAIRVIGSMLDLTAQRRAQSAERDGVALRETVAAMDQVLGVVGHELRTPLAGLRAISELVLTNDLEASGQTRELLRSLHDEVVRMSDTVDELLEAARLNSGRATWNWSRFPVGIACLEAVDTIRSLVDPRRVSLQIDVDPATAEMLGDADAIRRLLLNLLGNARKHTQAGFIRLRVREERDDAGLGWVCLTVADSGAGIPPNVLPNLGRAFALNSGVVGSMYVGGTGLGLSICAGIIEAHGGTMNVESEVNQGTTVHARVRSDLATPVAIVAKSCLPLARAA
jgi:PAS domain S-box-containing protein